MHDLILHVINFYAIINIITFVHFFLLKNKKGDFNIKSYNVFIRLTDNFEFLNPINISKLFVLAIQQRLFLIKMKYKVFYFKKQIKYFLNEKKIADTNPFFSENDRISYLKYIKIKIDDYEGAIQIIKKELDID